MDLSTLRATIIPAQPARKSRLAFWVENALDRGPWSDDSVALPTVVQRGQFENIELILPTPNGVGAVAVRAFTVELGGIIDELVALGQVANARGSGAFAGYGIPSASLRAWSEITKVALGLIARGRLQPAISADGSDQWTLGPLDDHDRSLRAHFVETLPPSAHCLAVGHAVPVRMLAPEVAVVAMYQAVADAFPRTPAAPLAVGQRAWASADINDISSLRSVLVGTDTSERTMVGLRLRLPETDEGAFFVDLQIRSAVDPSRVVDVADLWSGTASWFESNSEADLLRALRRAASVWPPLRRLLDESEPHSMELTDDEATDLFGPIAIDIGGAGVEVLIPAELTKTLQASAYVEPPPGDPVGQTFFDLTSVCQLSWRATIDGEPVSDEQLEQLTRRRRPLVNVDGEWVIVDPGVIAKLARRDRLTAADALTAALGGHVMIDDEPVAVEVSGPIVDLASKLRSAAEPEDIEDPRTLKAELRPYQRRGVAWIEEMSSLGFGGVLADDMGLGKTIQVIALLLRRAERVEAEQDLDPDDPTLVVCPASVVSNWVREVERFAPSIRVLNYTGPDRSLDGVEPADIVVTTYGLARRDVVSLSNRQWGLVIADEAQHIKNPSSSTARAMRQIPARSRFALTGTPVENRLTELWSLLDWTTPGLLGSIESFRRKVSIPIERDRNADATARFSRMISPFLMRRRKDDPLIAPELPPKTETHHRVLLTEEQAVLYRATADAILAQVHSADGIARRGLVLKLLTALKQVCNHPAHYLGETDVLAERSGKLDAFDELVGAISEAGDSTLVFTQYVKMGNLLMKRLSELGIAAEFLNGSVPLRKRTEMVDRFQAGDFGVFVVSLKAGGTGLNLTRATHVIHYDRWWNPAVENQASDRAWRIGQDRPVQVHQLISEGTLEERIDEVLAQKQALADAVVGSGEAWLTELDNNELDALVMLGSDD